jgi:hypothetical protein
MPAPALAPASNVPPASNATVGSSSVPGGFSATTKGDAYDSADEYEYEGKWSGAIYSHSTNRNNARDLYVGSGPYCHHASTKKISSDTAPSSDVYASLRTSSNLQGIKTIYLPKAVLNLLQNLMAQRRHTDISPIGTSTTFIVANTGATNHMLPKKTAFISYTPVMGQRVRMGNNSFASIIGKGSAIISLNSNKTLICDCLHVPDLWNPLYSLRAHQRQHGCGHIGMYGLGVYVFFPSFIIEVDTATNCHLRYQPLGRTLGLADLDYVQPKHTPSASTTAATLSPPVTIEPDNSDLDDNAAPIYKAHWPKCPPSPPVDQFDLSTLPAETKFTKPLNEMSREELITLLHNSSSPPTTESPPFALPKRKAADLLTCMDEKDIVELLHQPNSSLPLVCPCDTPNPLNKKLHWTAEELHGITGCHHFCNYKHLISATTDGQYIDNGEFPVSLGTYTTIPKAPQGKPIDRTPSKYLDIVHIDIAFGECMSVGGFKYALIFVDRATCFNWCFGLKSLHHDKIIAAFLAFQSKAGRLATQFWCDCNKKLFGSHI